MSSHSVLFGIRVLVYAVAIAAVVEAPRVSPSSAALRVIAEPGAVDLSLIRIALVVILGFGVLIECAARRLRWR
jgi:hypothetical protein